MNVLILLCLVTLFTFDLWAKCTIMKGKEKVTIADGTRVSLFDSGKSMENHKIQDQDGLGTCYGNATSAIMKSILPNNPDISYSHAALKASANNWTASWNNPDGDKYVKQGGEFFNTNGAICEAIDGMKKSGGACPKSFSLTENHDLYDVDVQEKLYAGLGKYFDKMNTIKNDPAELEKCKQNLGAVVKAIKDQKAKLKKQCEDAKSQDYPLEKALGGILSTTILLANEKDPCEKAVADKIKTLATPDSYIKSDRVNLTPKKELTDDLRKEINSNPRIAMMLKLYMDMEKHHRDTAKSITSEISPLIHKILKKYAPNEELSGCNNLDPAKSPLISKHSDEDEIVRGMRDAKHNKCDTFLPDYKIRVESSEIRAKLAEAEGVKDCVALEKQEEILDAVLPMMELGIAVDDALLDSLSDPVAQNAHQMERALMPGCLNKENLIKMDDISCEATIMCDWGLTEQEKSYAKFKGKGGGCLDQQQAQTTYRSKVMEGINEGRAIGVTVCTDFLKNPNANTNFCNKTTSGIPKHQFHVMSISGYRCMGGEVQYEVVNSWGAQHCPAEAKPDKATGKEVYKNEALECELDETGSPTGKYWVKEKALINNTTALTDVKKKDP